MPTGLSALLIASIFAAGAINSALAALSQTSVSGVYQRYIRRRASERHYLTVSRVLIVAWAVVLAGLALVFHRSNSQGLLNLGLRVPGYVYGALLGIALLALWRRGTVPGIVVGVMASIAAVLWLRAAQIAFFWWYPAGCLVMMVVALAISRARVEPGERMAVSPAVDAWTRESSESVPARHTT